MASHLYALEPQYQACRLSGYGPAPLGTILVADLTGDVVAAVEAVGRSALEPWCPVVLVSRTSWLNRTLEVVLEQFPLAPTLLSAPGEANLLDAEAIARAVRGRPAPSARELTRYVTLRADRSDLADTLAHCFSRGLGTPETDSEVSRSTLNRRLAGFGPLKPHDWSAMARTIEVMLDTAPLTESADTHGIDPRTIHSHLERYTALEFDEARTLAGWEWIVESALRRLGYVEAHEPTVPPMRRRAEGG